MDQPGQLRSRAFTQDDVLAVLPTGAAKLGTLVAAMAAGSIPSSCASRGRCAKSG